MKATNKNIIIYLVLILIIVGSSLYMWWQARVQPDQVLARIEAKLNEFSAEVAVCKKETDLKKLESCAKRMKEIRKELDNFQDDLTGIKTTDVATSTAK